MKHALPLLLILALLTGLPACAPQAGSADLSPADIGSAIAGSQPEDFSAPLLSLTAAEEGFADYVTAAYGLEADAWEDGAVAYHSGVGASEIAVLLMKGEAQAEEAAAALLDYVQRRTGDFFGYAPAQAALLEEALVLRRGRYTALVVCPDPEGAQAAFEACFEDGVPALGVLTPEESGPARDDQGLIAFDPPNAYDMTPYDTAPLLEAWRTGDRSALSEDDQALLLYCEAALEACISDGMSDYEKELAVHDWIIGRAEYDWSHSDRSLTPLGLLQDGTAICLGYASTFQLLMDLLGIECITVVGASFGSSEDHAWNMVKLDGAWYCVDVTWDDPGGGGQAIHRYFNVTSQFMRDTDHQWDYGAVPEATAEEYAYRAP